MAEAVARRHKNKYLVIISGVGVREYYRRLGYRLKKEYMVKSLSGNSPIR